MTAKRFTINTLDGSIDLRDDNKVMTYKEVVDLLNNLYEENQRLIKMLDNVANYMQKQNKNIPIDDFVEWWNNMATEGL